MIHPLPSTAACLVLSALTAAQSSRGDLEPESARALEQAIEESLHTVRSGPAGSWLADSPRLAMVASFEADGLNVRAGTRRLGVALEAWGRAGALAPVEALEPCVQGRRVEYRRAGVTEWYLNDPRGLEQGFTVNAPVEGDGPLWLVQSVAGGLTAEVQGEGRDARFVDADGETVFHYTGLRAWDSAGLDLETWMVSRDRQLAILVEDAGASYPITVDPWIATEEAELAGSLSGPGDELGRAIDIDGDTAVVGAPKATGFGALAGRAYVFVRNGTTWTEQAMFGGGLGMEFLGWAVAVEGDRCWIGVPGKAGFNNAPMAGQALEFVRTGTTWGPGQSVVGTVQGGQLGYSLDLEGDTLVLGTPYDGAGSVGILSRSSGTWAIEAFVSGTTSGDLLGFSSAVEGDTAVAGAPGEAGGGAAHVYTRSGTTWTEEQRLVAAATTSGDAFGTAVAVDGDTLVVGDPQHGGSGAAWAFARSGTSWSEQAQLLASGTAAGDEFGAAVLVEGDTALVGAPAADGPPDSGAVHVFERVGSTWGEGGMLTADDATDGDRFGSALAKSGDSLAVGARKSDASGLDSGSAYVYRIGGFLTYCTAGTSASGCQAAISAFGTPSATAPSGFDLGASGVEGAKDGLFFFGTAGQQANPWGNGTSFQCVVPPVSRAGLLTGSGTVGLCDGSFTQDLNARWTAKPAQNPGAGAVVQAQLWYRDPLNTSNQTTSLSDAIEFTVAP